MGVHANPTPLDMNFYNAARNGRVNEILMWKNLGADINSDNEGITPAFAAAAWGHMEVVKLLHDLGANITTPSNDGATPVFAAANNGHMEMVNLLHGLRADITTPCNDGATPVYAAA